ncbi:MAG: DctM domain-containing protein [Succiniclasticum sp.]|jgi:TRAP-type transport system large permease protein
MIAVLLPVLFLILVTVCKKIPLIGGSMTAAFFGAGVIALLAGGKTDPIAWLPAWLQSFNSIAFIFYIVILGAVFSALQVETGAMETVLNVLRALFGKTPAGLVFAILAALYIGGALMGTVAAVGAVIGLLVVPSLKEMGMDADLICATIVTGASLGGMMPPVSNAVILASGLVGIDATPALLISYVSVGIGMVIISVFFCKVYVKKEYRIPEHLIPKESALTILRRNWTKLIPLVVLIVCVMLNSIPALKFDLPRWILSHLPGWHGNLFVSIKGVYVLGKITNNIVMSMIFAIIACFLCHRGLWRNIKGKLVRQVEHVYEAEVILIATAFFLGAFKLGGQNHMISQWAAGLDSTFLILGGSFALVLAGMLTGGQSTAQSMILPILGPAWHGIGISDLNITLASAHLGMAGQGLPPCDMNTFIIAGLVGGLLGQTVNPLRSMVYSSPYCLYLVAAGLYFLF